MCDYPPPPHPRADTVSCIKTRHIHISTDESNTVASSEFHSLSCALDPVAFGCCFTKYSYNAHWCVLLSIHIRMWIEEFDSVRFDSVCLCSNRALHNSVQLCTVMSHMMYHVISSSAVCMELIQKEVYWCGFSERTLLHIKALRVLVKQRVL